MNHEELKFTIRTLSSSLDAAAFAHVVKNHHPSDVADALVSLSSEETVALLLTLTTHPRTELFTHFNEHHQDKLLRAMPREAVVELFELLPSDDRADLYNRLSHEAQQKLLPALAKVERDDILKFAAYPEGSAGSVTTSDYVRVSPQMSVDEALAYIRTTATDKETIYVIYVVNQEHQLIGIVSLRDLIIAEPSIAISDIMRQGPISINANASREEAAELIRRYDLLALPVINGGERMIGIVTVDDAMDIEKEQDTTQLARFGGTATIEGEDLDVMTSPISTMVKVRLFWLVILTVFGVVTSTFVAAQEEILSQVIVLAAFISPIVDMGGNAGSQSATLVIRSMALGDLKLKWRDVGFIIMRELPVALILGVVIAILEVVLAYFSKGVGFDVLWVVGLSMLLCTVAGSVIGALLPFLARRMGTDPATLSSPLITSVMDLLGVFIYFYLAYVFLGHLLV